MIDGLFQRAAIEGGFKGPAVVDIDNLDKKVDNLSLWSDRAWVNDYMAMAERRNRCKKELCMQYGGCDD